MRLVGFVVVVVVLVLAPLGCGRVGFDALDGGTGSGSPGSGGSGATANGDGGFVEATCASSSMLASFHEGITSSHSGSYSAVTVALHAGTTGPGVGDDPWLVTGATGTTDYHFADTASFGALAASLTDTVPGTVTWGFTFQPGGSGDNSMASDGPFVGAKITMIRRVIQTLAIAPQTSSTSIMLDATWQIWGCF